MTTASLGTEKYLLQLYNGRHTFHADEPLSSGGTDKAPAPDELLEASLASCTAITLKMYADRKGWKIETIEVEVTLQREKGKTVFTKQISITGAIGTEEKQRLLQIANVCPVSKTLLGETAINSTINE